MRVRGTIGRRRLAALGLAVALVLAPAAAASAATPTSTTTTPGSARAAAVQAVLDRVLGPGAALVTVSDTVRSSTAATTSVRWGTGVTGSSAAGVTTVAGRTSTSIARQDLVDGTSTATVTPAGALVRQSVSVAVDRAHLGARSPATLKRLVAAAAGIMRSRGDSLSLVVLPFAAPPPAAARTSPSMTSVLMADAVPAIWALGGVLAAVVLALALGGRTRRSKELARP